MSFRQLMIQIKKLYADALLRNQFVDILVYYDTFGKTHLPHRYFLLFITTEKEGQHLSIKFTYLQ